MALIDWEYCVLIKLEICLLAVNQFVLFVCCWFCFNSFCAFFLQTLRSQTPNNVGGIESVRNAHLICSCVVHKFVCVWICVSFEPNQDLLLVALVLFAMMSRKKKISMLVVELARVCEC